MLNKLKILFLLIVIACITCGCAVNENTGKFQIINSTGLTLKNVYVGSTLIALNINPGTQFDYWVFNSLKGELKMEGPDKSEFILADATTVKNVLDDAVYTLKPGYIYQVEVYIDGSGDSTVAMEVSRFDEAASGDDTYAVVD